VELRIRTPHDRLALPSLRAWLVREPDLRGKVTLVPSTESDHLGGVWEAVAIAAGSGGLGVVLVQTLGDWLKSRNRETSIEITIKDGDREIKGTAKNTTLSELTELLRALDTPDSSERDSDDPA
jgi:hypothetical protein